MAWSIGMAWCVVYTGEHYAIDVVTGYVLAAIVVLTLSRLGLLHAREVCDDGYAEPAPLARGAPRSGQRAA
jgi:hypothetical protein